MSEESRSIIRVDVLAGDLSGQEKVTAALQAIAEAATATASRTNEALSQIGAGAAPGLEKFATLVDATAAQVVARAQEMTAALREAIAAGSEASAGGVGRTAPRRSNRAAEVQAENQATQQLVNTKRQLNQQEQEQARFRSGQGGLVGIPPETIAAQRQAALDRQVAEEEARARSGVGGLRFQGAMAPAAPVLNGPLQPDLGKGGLPVAPVEAPAVSPLAPITSQSIQQQEEALAALVQEAAAASAAALLETSAATDDFVRSVEADAAAYAKGAQLQEAANRVASEGFAATAEGQARLAAALEEQVAAAQSSAASSASYAAIKRASPEAVDSDQAREARNRAKAEASQAGFAERLVSPEQAGGLSTGNQRFLLKDNPETAAEIKKFGEFVGATSEQVQQARRALGLLSEAELQQRDRLAAFNQAFAEDNSKLSGAIAQQIAAYDKLTAVLQRDGTLDTTAGTAARQRTLVADEKVAEVAAGGGRGGIRGFVDRVGGGDGSGSSSLGQAFGQAQQVAGYLALYQGLRLVQTGFKDAITQSIDFERAVTDLQNRLDLTRGAATGLANNLTSIGSPAGLTSAQSAGLGAQFAGTFQGQGTTTGLAQQGTQLGAELAVLGGSAQKAQADLEDLIAATRAFNLTSANTSRVLDAATSAAQNFGLTNAQAILPGLAQIGDLATAAGFSVEQTANTLADLQSRTGESSAATAGELQRFFGREGNASFQQVFAGLGIDTLQPFNQELAALSGKFDTLTQKQKDFITAQFGGGRAGVAALGLIEDYAKVQDKTNKTVSEGGIAQEQYYKRLDDVKGILGQLRGEFDNLAKDLGTSGIGVGIGVLYTGLKPILDIAVALFDAFDKIPAPLREAAFLVAEIAGAFALVEKLNIGERLGNLATAARGGISKAGSSTLLGGAGQAEADAARVAETEEATAAAKVAAAEQAAATEESGVKIAAAGFTASTTLTEAFSLGAVKIAAGLDALNIAILRGTGQIAAAEAVSAAERVGAGGVAAAATSLGGVEVGVTLRAVAGELAGIGASLLEGAGSLIASVGPIGLAIGTAIGLFEAFGAANRIDSAPSIQGLGGGSQENLLNAASAAGNAAAKDSHASAGIFGTAENFLKGDPTGNAARANRAQQAEDVALQKQIQTGASSAATPTNRDEALVNLADAADGTNGLAQSIKNLANAGATAGDQFSAVVARLNDAALAAQGIIPAGQISELSAAAGTLAAKSINDSRLNLKALNERPSEPLGTGNIFGIPGTSFIKDGVSAGTDFLFKNGKATASGGNPLNGLNDKSLSKAAGGAISDFLSAQPADQALTPQDIVAEKKKVLDALIAEAKKEGKSTKQIQNILPELTLAAASAVGGQLETLIGAGTLSGADIAATINTLQGVAAKAGADTATNASLSGADGASAGADATLARLNTELTALQSQPNANPDDFRQLNQDIANAQLAKQKTVIAALKASGDLAASAVSQYDKDGQIRASLNTLNSQLAGTTDLVAREALQAQINRGNQQAAAQQVADANSSIEASVNSKDAQGEARAKYQEALNKLGAITSAGVTSGQAFTDAEKAVANAAQAVTDANVAALNSFIGLNTGIQDTTTKDTNAIQAAINLLNSLPASDVAGRNQQKQAIKNASQQSVLDAVAALNSQAVAQIDPRDTAATDAQAVQSARLILANTQQFSDTLVNGQRVQTDAYSKAQEALNQALVKQNLDGVALAASQTTAFARAGDPLAQAAANLQNAQAAANAALFGSQDFFVKLAAASAAQAAYATALAANAKLTFENRSDTTDPVEQAIATLVQAQAQLLQDQFGGTGSLAADELSVTKANLAKQQAQFSQQLSLQQTAFDLHQESGAAYLQFLESQDATIRKTLSGLKRGSSGYQQAVDELNTIDKAILSYDSQFAGQFNLGTIKLPTDYQVRRQLAATAQGSSITSSNVQNILVTINGADINAVKQYLSDVLGPTSVTVSTAGRKGT